MRSIQASSSIVILGTVLMSCAIALGQTPAPKDNSPAAVSNPLACSYTATNGNCTLTIDRLNPVTPPTIYVRRGDTVSVVVNDLSPFEDLTLDWKSSAVVIPPDTFQAAFTPETANLGKLSIVGSIKRNAPPPPGPFNKIVPYVSKCPVDPNSCTGPDDIAAGQDQVLTFMKVFDPVGSAAPALGQIKVALQPPPGNIGDDTQPWHNTEAWRNTVTQNLQIPVDKFKEKVNEVATLAGEVAAFKSAHATEADRPIVANLNTNQETLDKALKAFEPNIAKLSALSAAVSTVQPVPPKAVFNGAIKDTKIDPKDYQTQTWTLDYTNKLLPVAKRVSSDTLKSESAAYLGSLADASTKVSIVTITIQFQSPSRIEVSTGLMVPLAPYHSYAKASVAANGVVTDNVVQETKTYALVPMVLINILAKEWVANTQRSAIFVTGGVGVNTATTTVEFGAGLTYSYRSIAISGLIDIGRDTQLAGGFKVGQSLGPTNAAANPLTSTYWTVKPAVALSVRIPLGGSSSSK
jgi:hypothetical protein